MQYKMIFVGETERIAPFQLLGIDVCYIEDVSKTKQQLNTLINHEYGIIFITERAASPVMEFIQTFDDKFLPAFIIIPSDDSSSSIGISRIEMGVKRAIGHQILRGGTE